MFQFWHYQLNCFFCAFRNWWFLNTHDCWSVFPVFERYRWRYNERFVLCFPRPFGREYGKTGSVVLT